MKRKNIICTFIRPIWLQFRTTADTKLDQLTQKRVPMKRRRYTKEFKAKVALEAIKGQKTANELASEFGSM